MSEHLPPTCDFVGKWITLLYTIAIGVLQWLCLYITHVTHDVTQYFDGKCFLSYVPP